MEFQDLTQQIEWENRRIAAVFNVEEWKVERLENRWRIQGSGKSGESVLWSFDGNHHFVGMRVGSNDSYLGQRAQAYRKQEQGEAEVWVCHPHPEFSELLARGLYQLGVEDEDVFAQLGQPLTAHEKLELRDSLPREFWPPQWRGNDAAPLTSI